MATMGIDAYNMPASGDNPQADGLVAAKARNNSPGKGAKDSPVFAAASSGRLQDLKGALMLGSSANGRDRRGDWTALHACSVATAERLEIAKALLAAGADVDARTALNGDTSLHLACRSDDDAFAAVLIEAGADVNAVPTAESPATNSEQYPIIICATGGHAKVLKLLLAAPGVQRDVKFLDSTPLQLAEANGHRECVQLLGGADGGCVSS